MSGPGDDSGQFHAIVSEQIEQHRKSIDQLAAENRRLAAENRLLKDAFGRLLPPEPDPGDELAARRRRKREQRRGRNAGLIALPIAIGALLRNGIARGAVAAAGAGTIALAAGATILAVDSHPLHPASPPSPAAHSAPLRPAPRRARSNRPTPRRGQGKGTAARSTTDTPPPVSRSRAAVPQATTPGVTQTAPAPAAATTPAVTVTTPPIPAPTRLPSPIPSVTKVITRLLCHLNLLGIRVCVTTAGGG